MDSPESHHHRHPTTPPTASVEAALNGSNPDPEELRQVAQDLVDYFPALASMLAAMHALPPYIGLN